MATNNKRDLKHADIWLESQLFLIILPLFIYLIDCTCKIY